MQILQRECERLEPYIVDSPDKLREMINEMQTSLFSERKRLDNTERQSRALQNSSDSFRIVEQDVNSCIKIMEDCDRELLKLEECQKKVQRHEEQVHQKEAECREIERKEERLNRNLANAKEKLDKARAHAAAKREAATKEMEELKVEYDTLAKAREASIREADRKNQQIEIKKKEVCISLQSLHLDHRLQCVRWRSSRTRSTKSANRRGFSTKKFAPASTCT